jgi:hypothetical protein
MKMCRYDLMQGWGIAMKNDVPKTQRLDLIELPRKAGLILRQPDSAMICRLFTRLEEYDEQERARTFDCLKLAINETRFSVGADAAYDDP